MKKSRSIDIVLYSRPSCHLCDVAEDVIRDAQKRYGFNFNIVNIQKDPDLETSYGALIPVIQINGKTVFKYRVDKTNLERQIEQLWNT